MRRHAVPVHQILGLLAELRESYDLVDHEVDAGPKVLRITGPRAGRSALAQAARQSTTRRRANEALLHGRDGLAIAPELSHAAAPTWGELWPSARALAAYFGHCVRMRGIPAVEINAGLGSAGLGAAAKGGRLLITDPDPEALRFARYNAAQNGLVHVRTMPFDWHSDRLDGHVGSLIFADVLHDPENFERVFRMLRDNLTPGATAFLAEPGRPVAAGFFEALRKTAYRVRIDMERVEDARSYYLVSLLRIRLEI